MRPVKILSLDTSGSTQSVAVLEGEEVLAKCQQAVERSHTELLLPNIDRLLNEVSWGLEDIELFALTHGPGSFTGVRIGITAVKGLAFGRQTPVQGVDTLKALAASHLWGAGEGAAGGSLGDAVLVAMDARMQELYAGLYALEDPKAGRASAIKTLMEPQVMGVKDLLTRFKGEAIGGSLLGNASQAYPELLAMPTWSVPKGEETLHEVQAPWVGRLAAREFSKPNPLSSIELKPHYLRASTAEIKRNT